MGAAAYNRGSRLVAMEADGRMPEAIARAGHQALEDENARLREHLTRLEGDLARARRCLAAERYGREKRVGELEAALRATEFGVSILCRLATRLGAPGFRAEAK